MLRLTFLVRLGRGETDDVSNGRVSQVLVVRAQRRIGDGPVSIRIVNRLVVLPSVRVRRIIHAHFEILCAAEKEVAVLGELP